MVCVHSTRGGVGGVCLLPMLLVQTYTEVLNIQIDHPLSIELNAYLKFLQEINY